MAYNCVSAIRLRHHYRKRSSLEKKKRIMSVCVLSAFCVCPLCLYLDAFGQLLFYRMVSRPTWISEISSQMVAEVKMPWSIATRLHQVLLKFVGMCCRRYSSHLPLAWLDLRLMERWSEPKAVKRKSKEKVIAIGHSFQNWIQRATSTFMRTYACNRIGRCFIHIFHQQNLTHFWMGFVAHIHTYSIKCSFQGMCCLQNVFPCIVWDPGAFTRDDLSVCQA